MTQIRITTLIKFKDTFSHGCLPAHKDILIKEMFLKAAAAPSVKHKSSTTTAAREQTRPREEIKIIKKIHHSSGRRIRFFLARDDFYLIANVFISTDAN